MFSFIRRRQRNFARAHGFAPNVLYMNRAQYQRLKRDLGDESISSLGARLGLEIILSNDVVHPNVGWSASATGRSNYAIRRQIPYVGFA